MFINAAKVDLIFPFILNSKFLRNKFISEYIYVCVCACVCTLYIQDPEIGSFKTKRATELKKTKPLRTVSYFALIYSVKSTKQKTYGEGLALFYVRKSNCEMHRDYFEKILLSHKKGKIKEMMRERERKRNNTNC